MIYRTPPLDAQLSGRLAELDRLRERLREGVGTSSPWLGTLRRQVKASAAASSTSIEGFVVSADDALALVAGDPAGAMEDEDRVAVSCYARAMDHVGVMATDSAFLWLDRVILDLHFDACYFQRDKSPGHWRTGPIAVTAKSGTDPLYRGPDAERVPALMAAVVDWLDSGDLEVHAVVRAAMAHLHIAAVHPFRDGNGRVSRIVQSLVLAREGLVSLEFGSIEEHLADNTEAYYAALQEIQGGTYQPDRDAAGWVEFCVDAHLSQARRRLSQIEAAAVRWSALEAITGDRGWPDRLVIALEQALMGGSGRRAYIEESGISAPTASNDYRRLLDAGLVEQRGRGPSTRYVASDTLSGLLDG